MLLHLNQSIFRDVKLKPKSTLFFSYTSGFRKYPANCETRPTSTLCPGYSIMVAAAQKNPVLLYGAGLYTLIQNAYAQAADNGTIQLQAVDFNSDMFFNRDS